MNRATALLAVAGMIAASALALLAPWPLVVGALALAVVAMRGRRAFLLFAAIAVAIHVAIMAYVDRDEGGLRGLIGATRLSAALACNLAIVTRLGAAQLLDGLRLPARVTAFLAATLLAAEDIARDFARLRDARRLEGTWPRSRFAQAREAARLVPPLFVASQRRGEARRDALQLAGYATRAWFVPLVAVAALSAAGRMAFLALPNVALTYVVAFLGGLLYGWRVGAAGAFLGMALTDFLLTGLYPAGFVNAPAMAALALVGGAMRRVRIDAALAATIGILSTFLFSVAADSLTWLLLYTDTSAAWLPIVLAGLVFNVIPALVNGALFAASVAPTQRAFRAWQEARQRGATEARPPPASRDEPAAG